MHVLLFTLLIVCSFPLAVSAEEGDDIAELIRRTELKAPSKIRLSDKKLKEVALLSLDVEAKRQKYARTLDLYLERIGADKDCDQARIDYEKAQVALASKWNRTREVLNIIRKQEKLAQDWKKKCAASRETTSEATNVSGAKRR